MLSLYAVNKDNLYPTGTDLLLDISDLSFKEVYTLLDKKNMLNRKTLALRFKEYQYLDEVFKDDKIRTDLEECLFSLIENQHKSQRFLYFVFKIKTQSLEELIHNGFYEWLEYWMLFFKFTHINFVIEMNEDSIATTLPIEYVITKRIDNPRISIFINADKWPLKDVLPEDISSFVTIVKNEKMKKDKNLPYATMWIK